MKKALKGVFVWNDEESLASCFCTWHVILFDPGLKYLDYLVTDKRSSIQPTQGCLTILQDEEKSTTAQEEEKPSNEEKTIFGDQKKDQWKDFISTFPQSVYMYHQHC